MNTQTALALLGIEKKRDNLFRNERWNYVVAAPHPNARPKIIGWYHPSWNLGCFLDYDNEIFPWQSVYEAYLLEMIHQYMMPVLEQLVAVPASPHPDEQQSPMPVLVSLRRR